MGLNDKQRMVVGVSVFCLFVSFVAVGLRLLARRLVGAKLWWDDYMTIVSLFLSIAPNLTVLLGVRWGLGQHVSDLPPDNIRKFVIAFWVHQVTWPAAFQAVIVTILLLYIRIFPNAWLRKACYIIAATSMVYTIIVTFILIFQCTPVNWVWDRQIPGGHYNFHTSSLYIIPGIGYMVFVVLIYCLPMQVIWKLQITRAKKWGLLVVFSVGAFACVASLMRVVLVHVVDSRDLTWTVPWPIIWSCLEISIGVVSTCVPSCLPLILILTGKKSMSGQSKSQVYGRYNITRTKPAKSSHFNRMDDLDGHATLEGLELSTTSHKMIDDNDKVGLVDRNLKDGEIVVTNQIIQTSEPSSQKSLPTGNRQQDSSNELVWKPPRSPHTIGI